MDGHQHAASTSSDPRAVESAVQTLYGPETRRAEPKNVCRVLPHNSPDLRGSSGFPYRFYFSFSGLIMYCKTYKTEIFGADRNFPDSRCRVPGSRYLPCTVKRIKPKFSEIMTEIFGKTKSFGKKRPLFRPLWQHHNSSAGSFIE